MRPVSKLLSTNMGSHGSAVQSRPLTNLQVRTRPSLVRSRGGLVGKVYFMGAVQEKVSTASTGNSPPPPTDSARRQIGSFDEGDDKVCHHDLTFSFQFVLLQHLIQIRHSSTIVCSYCAGYVGVVEAGFELSAG